VLAWRYFCACVRAIQLFLFIVLKLALPVIFFHSSILLCPPLLLNHTQRISWLYKHHSLYCDVDKDLEGISVRKITVEIVRPTTSKRFLGGYRSRQTGIEYHHVAVQTMPLRTEPDRSTYMFTRSTQTAAERHFAQQTSQTTSTQMTGIGVYVPNLTDKLLEPRRYVTAEEFIKIKSNQVRVAR